MMFKIFSTKLFFLLLAFWVLITGSLNWQSILTGIVASAAVTVFNNKPVYGPAIIKALTLKDLYFLIIFILTLIWEILKANIQVAKIVLQKDMPISPMMIEFPSPVKSPLMKTVLANAITLTPGTLTVELEGDRFVVHCLTCGHGDEVKNWSIANYLVKIEGVGDV